MLTVYHHPLLGPDAGQYLLAREDAPPVGQQQAEYLELLARQAHLGAVDGASLVQGVDRQSLARSRSRGLLGLYGARAAQHGAHARQHVAYRIWLGYIVISADVEPGHHIVLVVARGAEYYWHRGQSGVLLHGPCHVKPARLAHHHVEQNQGILLQIENHGLLGAICRVHLIALDFEIEFQCVAQRSLVIDHEYLLSLHISCKYRQFYSSNNPPNADLIKK